MRRGNGTMMSDYAINIQTDNSKTQNDKQEDQSNKGVHKKSMIQTLQSYDNIRNRLRLLGESIPYDQDLMNGAKATETSKQIIYNSQKKNENMWIEASGKKRNSGKFGEQPRTDNVAQTTKEERTSIKQTPLSISKYLMTRTTT